MTEFETESEPPFWGWTGMLMALGLAFASLVSGSLMLAVPYMLIRRRGVSSLMEIAMPAQFAGYVIWLVCLWAVFRYMYGHPFWSAMQWRMPQFGLLPYVLAGPLLAVAIGLLGTMLHAKESSVPMIEDLLKDPVSRWWLIAFGVTVGPLCEEIFFRGLLLPLVDRAAGVAVALLVTSVPFALLHGPQYGWSWQHMVLLVLASVVFGAVKLLTRTLTAPVALHCAYNATMFAGYLMTLRNQPPSMEEIQVLLRDMLPALLRMQSLPW